MQVLEAYKLGVAALKSTLNESGLTEESATDTMVQVEEVSCTIKHVCVLDYVEYTQFLQNILGWKQIVADRVESADADRVMHV